MLFLLLSAGLITDKVHILADNEEISMHRITKDSMYKYIYQYFNEANPLFLKPVDACRYYFTPDSFYLVVLDEKWERIIWLKCREEGKGFYTSGEAHRFGGTVHAPGLLRNPSRLDGVETDFYVADQGNNRVLKMSFSSNGDTLEINRIYRGPYNGLYLSNPIDVAVDHFMGICGRSVIWILDKGNRRYVKLNPDGSVIRTFTGESVGIDFDEIVGIAGKDYCYYIWGQALTGNIFLSTIFLIFKHLFRN